MVFVSINYRLNIFAFGDGKEKNLALKDQRLGIEWVRKNIASFGGDPVCPTVILESSVVSINDSILEQYHLSRRECRWCVRSRSFGYWTASQTGHPGLRISLPLTPNASNTRRVDGQYSRSQSEGTGAVVSSRSNCTHSHTGPESMQRQLDVPPGGLGITRLGIETGTCRRNHDWRYGV